MQSNIILYIEGSIGVILLFYFQKIQLICTTLDCLDTIALITGYYKVYVDNTSNTPLPVENEEKWPFTFRRDPPVNDGGYRNIRSF